MSPDTAAATGSAAAEEELRLTGQDLAAVRVALQGLALPSQLTRLVLAGCCLPAFPAACLSLPRLADLDLSSCQLREVPEEVSALRTSLRYLNLMNNQLSSLPQGLGSLSELRRLGLKDNQLTGLPSSLGGMGQLVELFLTGNQLTGLPASLSQCTALVKLQASFNQLRSLPSGLGALTRLELLRVAVNELAEEPACIAELPSLAWLSLAGNPCCPADTAAQSVPRVAHSALRFGSGLGAGASGDVCRATTSALGGAEQAVAVKTFRASTSPDGRCADEVAVACRLDHPHLSRVLAQVEEPRALLLRLEPGQPLADRPNLQSLLRCRWAPGARFSAACVARVAAALASALAYLHAAGIAHGDVYAHNVLADAEARHVVLLDFGAAFTYTARPDAPYETLEVRALGLLLRDMEARLSDGPSALLDEVVALCLRPPNTRPSFAALLARLPAAA